MSAGKEKNILSGGPEPPLFEADAKSFGEVVLRKLSAYGEAVMFIDGITGATLTAKASRLKSIRLAKALALKYGIKEGDVIGICCENRLEYPIIIFAAFYLGATIAPINITYTDREFHHALNLSHPKLIFASKAVTHKLEKVAAQSSFIHKIITIDAIDQSPNNHKSIKISLDELLSCVDINDCNAFNCKPVDFHNNVAFVLCSSGTTGLPKGVELSQLNVLTGLSQLNTTVAQALTYLGRLSILLVIPCFHTYGLLSLVGSSICGAEIVLLPKFEENSFLNAIQTYKPNTAFLVPPLLLFLAKSPLVDQYDLSSLLLLGCGAAPLSKEINDAVCKRLNIFALRQGYGMSEMTFSVLTQSEGFDKTGSVGTLRAGVYGKVIDTETGEPLGPHQRGEMCFKGSSIMRGYINNKEATQQIIDSDGWLHTGDIGYYDDDHEWFIVDRLKELIKYNGYQVPPAEIEAILLGHPHILDAAVIGIPDEKAGELPFAFVVRKPNTNLSQKDVIDFVADTASPAKRLHGGVQFIDVIPKNPTGKILRRVLREQITKQIISKL